MNPKKVVYVFTLLVIIVFQFALPYPAHASCSGTIFVNASSGSGSPDGCSWGTAFSKLQDAIAVASSGDQIWVAAGTYYPDEGTGQTDNDRNSTFQLKNGISIYGGFTGGETLLSQRDSNPATNNTILSGDIDGTPNDIGLNAFHVVSANSSSMNAVLDGFTITGANSTGAGNFEHGAGIFVSDSSPTFSNLIIRNNTSAATGGGIFIVTYDFTLPEASYVRPSLTNITISNNTAIEGGGLSIQNASPVLNNIVITGNTATGGAGGGMYSNTLNLSDAPSVPQLTNVTFSNNTARGGAGIYNFNSNAIVNNVTFSGNTALRRGGGMLNENASPSLTNVTFYGNISQESISSAPWGGGGMINITSNPTLNNVTFSGNNSVNGSGTAGGDAMRNTVNSNPVIRNSIFWGDVNDEINSDGTGTLTITDSVIQGGAADAINNIIVTDPFLGSLANNGGFTQTIAISDLSSARNTGGTITACAPADQRGVIRPQELACDIGAYELNAILAVTINQAEGQLDPTNSSSINFTVVFSQAVSDFATGDVTPSGTAGATTATVTGSGTTYNVAVSGMSNDGTVIASIAAGVAMDGAGNSNQASTSTDNTVIYDATAPDTTITSKPPDPDNDNTPSFSFTGNDGSGTGVASFECQIDGGGFAACTSGSTFGPLADQSHTFQVRAIDNIGNTDATPASYTWTIDTTAPDTTITSNPPSPDNDTTPTFSFTGNDGSGLGIASFECQIDSGGFTACTSGSTFGPLTEGSHTFQVRAIDNIGNTDATPASYTWTINTVPEFADVNVSIGAVQVGNYTLAPVPSIVDEYASMVAGPVKVLSTNGANIFASQRAIYRNSFNEVMGYPVDQFSTEYWFPWYDGVYMNTWVLVGNPSSSQTAYVDIYIGGVKQGPTRSIPANGNITPQFKGMVDGPVRVVSVTGTGTSTPLEIFTSERSIYNGSFSEVMGVPLSEFTTEYWFPWVDQFNSNGLKTWVLVGNPSSSQTAYVDIYIGGVKQGPTRSIPANGNITPTFTLSSGPVKVVSVTGTGTATPLKVFTSERTIYASSFNEMMGYPANQLATEYWFPWYDNLYMKTDVLIGRP